MKLVTAIIKPFKFDEVREALAALGVSGMTVTDVKGYGRQRGHAELYRSAEYVVEFVPKTMLQIIVADTQVDSALEAIVLAAQTGKVGDGKVFVTPIEQLVRVRTGETAEAAI